ncbi:AraC family transcriptional regulator [Novosphingobium sp. 9]|uniref:AraC family transcriptional regulator n=1 Tax=Novosphingobium sp. 9 TaxID=2025349 RepID=UPI0021B58F5B|nr:AraC family transcriptional regulator [Novosphingobium sp. 9]
MAQFAGMQDLIAAIERFVDRQSGVSPYATPVEGMIVMRSDHPKPPGHLLFRPSLCVVAQGAKWATFGGERLEYRAGQALVIGVETPSIGRVVEASPAEPCLVLALELDPAIMRSVAQDLPDLPGFAGEPTRGVHVTDFDGPLAACALRLVELCDTPEAVPVLRPLILREIAYRLLTGPRGGEIARLTLAGSPSRPVIEALHWLRERFRETVRVEDMAAVARMSASAFHRHFKALTAMSPLQYQKRLRLLEARRLMVARAFNVETACFEVGYESPSQFSRDYSRLFGAAPKRDVAELRVALAGARENVVASAFWDGPA